jgi:hypothetical protein
MMATSKRVLEDIPPPCVSARVARKERNRRREFQSRIFGD